ncbi:nitroreductase family protein [Methanobacterium spitsbergense]|uniref:Nitroreductase family protein n=1 Tax=Methanobacterium spitsbergense TaxID=2874285 RepID=A0A8T5URW0_9EURY|nr:nitroreductase family protein [Methanobacterium spitsbergense]MBZ2166792.1 nitroreductase family protein [Methanobacterium spitsbergense]
MNQTIETIKNRRSVRQYLPDQIKDQELEDILEAAIYAPTAHNDQPWKFTIIQNRELIDEINQGAKEAMKGVDIEWISKLGAMEGFNIFHGAPTAVIISGKKDAISPMVDCSAAIENMLLAAESMDIGSCWIGFAKFYFLNPESYKKFDIPDDHEVYYGVALGYKVRENSEAPERNRNVFQYFR